MVRTGFCPVPHSRYDWPVDMGPAGQGHAPVGDVSCRIEVCIEGKAAEEARECTSIPFPPDTTSRTILAGIGGVHGHDTFPRRFAFVSQEGFQLGVAPAAKHAVELASLLSVFPYRQFLYGEHIEVQCRCLFGYYVIAVPLKPSFPPRQTFQMASGRAGACGLQSSAEVAVSAPDISECS